MKGSVVCESEEDVKGRLGHWVLSSGRIELFVIR